MASRHQQGVKGPTAQQLQEGQSSHQTDNIDGHQQQQQQQQHQQQRHKTPQPHHNASKGGGHNTQSSGTAPADNDRSSGSGGTVLPSSNLGPVDDTYQVLRMEAATQNETRRLLGSMDVAFYLSAAALVAYFVLRWQPLADGTYFMCTTTFSAVNLAFACVLFPAAASTAGVTAYRCIRSLASNKRWTQRRRRLFGLYALQLSSATIGLACYLVSNAIVVSTMTCAAHSARRAIYWLAFVRWSCWNTTFLVTTIKAHATTIVPPKAAEAAAKQKWRRLLCLAWETPFDLFGQHQLHEMEQQAYKQQQEHQHEHEQQQQFPHAQQGRQASDTRALTDIETGLANGGSSLPQAAQQDSQDAGKPGTYRSRISGPLSAEQQPPEGSSKPGRQQKPQRPDMLVLDLPWYYHWPKAVVWLLFECIHIALAVGESLSKSESRCRVITDTCELSNCWPSSWLIGLLSTEVALALSYYAVWVWLVLRSSRLLHTRPWQAFKVANLVLRLERRLGVWAYSLIVVASVIFWFAGLGDCSRSAFQYQGLPVTELMWATISIIGMLFMQPTDPGKANPRTVVQLQQFSWTEASLEESIKDRNSAACKGKVAAMIAKQPMFCFETAVKLFFFSSFVYADYNGAREAASAGGAVGVPEVELEQLLKGMALYGLNVHKVIYDDDKELKVLFAWNSNCVVVCFRGSTTAANWIADAMMWRSAHPGSTWENKQAQWFNSPKIHTGFLRCWSGTGLDRRVLSMLTNLVDTSLDPSKLKIYFCGHSLGGALATLAAYDLLQTCSKLDKMRQVSVYTYGAPRAGNHAFARVYEKVVPDTWHVINDQDTIPRGGKFLSAYKRNGQRVVINKIGDIVVRPTPLEASMLQAAWGSNPLNHLLQSYQAALTAIALGQLDQLKALPGGAQGLLDLIKDCPIMAESMYRYGNQQNLILWIGGKVWYTLNSRAPLEVLRTSKLVSDHALMTNGDGSAMPPGGQAAAAAAARRAAARQRRLEMQQTRRQQQRERQQRRQQQRQLRRQGALAASSALDSVDLELGEGVGLRSGAGDGSSDADAVPAAAKGLRGRSRRPWQLQQQQQQQQGEEEAGVSAAFSRAAWWLTGGLLGTGPRQAAARGAWAQQPDILQAGLQNGTTDGAALAVAEPEGAAGPAKAAELALRSSAAAVDTSNKASSSSAIGQVAPAAVPPAVATAANRHTDISSSPAGSPVAADAAGSTPSSPTGDAVITIVPAQPPVAPRAAPAPAPAPAPAAAATPSTGRSSSIDSSNCDSFISKPLDPFEAAAAAKLCRIQKQASQERVTSVMPNPMSQVMGYLTGVMPAWPGYTNPTDAASSPGTAAAAAAAASGAACCKQPQQPLQQQQQQQQQRQLVELPVQQPQQQQQQQQEGIPVGSLICLSSPANSSSRSSSSSGDKEDPDAFWDAQESGNFSANSSGSIYFDVSGENVYQVPSGPATELVSALSLAPPAAAAAAPAAAGCGSGGVRIGGTGSSGVPASPFAAIAAATEAAAAAAPGGSEPAGTVKEVSLAALPAGLVAAPAAGAGPAPGTLSSTSSTATTTTTATSPFAAAAATPAMSAFLTDTSTDAAASASTVTASGSHWESTGANLAGGAAFPPSNSNTTSAGADGSTAVPSASILPGITPLLACCPVTGQQAGNVQQQSSLLASSSTAAALDAIQGVDPVASLGPGSATAMLLNPARTAPQALFNPAAALAGIRGPEAEGDKEEGTLRGVISKVIGSGGSSSSGRSSPASHSRRGSYSEKGGAAAGGEGGSSSPAKPSAGGGLRGGSGIKEQGGAGDAVKGALGMAGLKSSSHAAAGTVADTKGGSDGSSGSSRHRVGQRIKSLLPGHKRSSSSDGSVSRGSSAGGSSTDDPIEQRRYVYSLDVRRLSLASPLLPGSQFGEAAVLQTQLHMPVVPEGDEGTEQ